ncbi:hypothetical protein WJX81_004437 [Elliptochloris bilobata]|uniref:Uncharacterized protein n=1 Tax=Elliptochloris bilobata TaxID=381761 RepID=A0AAW1RTL5_9CHLO
MLTPFERPAVVLDCGTGYTKLGFAGNGEPSAVIPTVVAVPQVRSRPGPFDDLDYSIGDAALAAATSSALHYPVKQGMVESWDVMERFWQQCFFQHLRVDSSAHNVVLTEPALNTTEAREAAAEVLFESFSVPGLHIGVQAVFALYAAFGQQERGRALTGAVVDAGDGYTSCIPVVNGFVLSAALRSLPVAGRDVTRLVQKLLRERGAPVPPDQWLEVARQIKEAHCYTCSDATKERAKFDADPGKHVRLWEGVNAKSGARFRCGVGVERFLGPEALFRPEMVTSEPAQPLPEMVDACIQSCPIDTRRALYGNIVLSGGTTMFKNFGTRLQRDIQRIVDARMARSGGGALRVTVTSHGRQQHAAWFGGAMLGAMPEFASVCHTRAEYAEHGPSICRSNSVFRDIA